MTLKPPALDNDCFALPRGVDWTPVAEALQMLRSRLHPIAIQEMRDLSGALGRVLAGPVVAKRAHPPTANTAVDGYGFAHASLGEGDQVLSLVKGRAAAGAAYGARLAPGHALRILTGAPLPEGVDTVVLQEDVTLGEGKIAFRAGLKRGANTRRAGEDVGEGDEVLGAGRRLTAADLGLAAAVGVDRVNVFRPLRVGVLSTGDELAEPGAALRDDQIYDANRLMLLGLMEQMGHLPLDLGIAPDDRTALRDRLDAAAERADVIITSGGASAGDEDHMSALLTEAGAMALWRIAVKPGRPLALGVWRERAVFGLPGNPVAAMVCALIFARPALALMSGAGWVEPTGFDVPAGFSKTKKPGRREYLRARVRNGKAEVFASEGSGRISGLSWAEGLIELEEPARTISPGDSVRFLPFSGFLA